MSIGVNLESFRGFALVRQIMGKEGSVIRAEESGSLAGRKVQLSVADNDRAFLPFFRSQDAKDANTRTRDIFFRLVAEEFGGEKNIPPSVKAVLTNFGGASSKPLTARRIVAVCNAVMEAKSQIREPVNVRPTVVDNPRVDGAQEPGKISGDVNMGANDIALNVTTEAVARTVEKMLRDKMNFTSMRLTTATGRNGANGTVKLSLRGLDLPAFAATKGGFGFWALRKLGLMDMTDVDIDLRPSIDPVSKRIRLDVTGLSGTGSVGGVRGSLARKLLSKVLPLVFGDIGGVGFVSGDSMLSVTFDAGRLLGKVIPDHGNMIPGGIPAISEVSADENGFNVAVRL